MLTGFQYRAGLAITRTDLNELSNILGIHSATLIRYKKTPNLEFICARSKNVGLIISFFNSKGVLFKDKNIVLLDRKKDLKGLTRFHLVVGRIATGLNQSQLSSILKVSHGTISLLENKNNTDLINTKKINNTYLTDFFKRIGVILGNDYSVTLTKDPHLFFNR